ncbi:MAG: hypothetical protein ABWZ30_01015 [Jiangellaceae bacterium]
MFLYRADAFESKCLREVFGDDVTQVTFWDAEEGGGKFVQAEGYAADDTPVKKVTPGQPGWDTLEEVISERGETVKYGLSLEP